MALTNTKYQLQFTSIMGTVWKLLFIDQSNQYDGLQYPKDLKGGTSPVTLKYNNSSNEQYAPIITSELDISLLDDGTFDIEEFITPNERSWKIELYSNYNQLYWQGWLSIDGQGIQHDYDDDAYNIVQLTALDGLSDLKGFLFANGLGQYTPGTDIFGLIPYMKAIKYCLDQLGYNYYATNIFSSLRYIDGVGNTDNSWLKYSIWADQFYDENGYAQDSYTVLSGLLTSLGLQIYQQRGTFFLVSPNDLAHANSVGDTNLIQSAQSVSNDFTVQGNGLLPGYAEIGFDKPLKPRNKNAVWSYDYAYNQVLIDITYNGSSFLNIDPTFNLSTVGQLPNGWEKVGTKDVTGVIVSEIDSDNNVNKFLRVTGTTQYIGLNPANFLDQVGGYYIDQSGKKVNISFNWRPTLYTDPSSSCPMFALVFFDTIGGAYWFNVFHNQWENIQYSGSQEIFQFSTPEETLQTVYAWNKYTFSTTALPGSQIGTIYLRIAPPNAVGTNTSSTRTYTIDYDDFEITITDADDQYSNQIGETHLITNNTGFAKAQQKQITPTLYSYSKNKRYYGNVFYGLTYSTGIITSQMFLFRLPYPNRTFGMRLPEAVIRQIAKAYKQPYKIFTGDLLGDDFKMFSIYSVRFFESKIFIALSYSHDLKNSIISPVLREINDADFSYTYQYTAKYEKSARKL